MVEEITNLNKKMFEISKENRDLLVSFLSSVNANPVSNISLKGFITVLKELKETKSDVPVEPIQPAN